MDPRHQASMKVKKKKNQVLSKEKGIISEWANMSRDRNLMRRSRGQKLYDSTDQIQSLHFLWRIFFLIFAFINEDKISIKWKDTERGDIWMGMGRKQIQSRQIEIEDVYVHFIRQKDSEWSGQWVISFKQLRLSNKKTIWLLFKGLRQLYKPISDIFPPAFVHVLFLCHISVIFKVFQTFSLL